MISPNNGFVFSEGSKVTYNTELSVTFNYDPVVGGGQFQCLLRAQGDAFDLATYAGDFRITFDAATVDAKTGSGAETRDKLLNAVEQCVVDYLEGISDNSGVTFTIA